MPQIFPRWTNNLHHVVGASGTMLLLAAIFFIWYYGSPKYTDVGYRPAQPIPYSHKLHVDDLGLDCRYCHNHVEDSPVANVPPTQTCMNCHSMILPESEKLLPVRESWSTKEPIEWVKVHMLPGYAYFDHSAHVNAGVGCESCHGPVHQMEVVQQWEELSMSWCLDCHREPEMHLRPESEVTNMEWTPPSNQMDFAKKMIEEKNIKPPTNCSGCHR